MLPNPVPLVVIEPEEEKITCASPDNRRKGLKDSLMVPVNGIRRASLKVIEKLSESDNVLKPRLENSCQLARRSFSGFSHVEPHEDVLRRYSETKGSKNCAPTLMTPVPDNFRKLSCSDSDVENFMSEMTSGHADRLMERIGKASSRNSLSSV